jgi:hypothetical protein
MGSTFDIFSPSTSPISAVYVRNRMSYKLMHTRITTTKEPTGKRHKDKPAADIPLTLVTRMLAHPRKPSITKTSISSLPTNLPAK